MESSEPVTSRVSSVLRVYNPFLMTWPFLAFNMADTSQSCCMVKSKALSHVFRAFCAQINIHTYVEQREPNFTEHSSRELERASFQTNLLGLLFVPRVILSKKFVIFRNGFFTFLPSVAQSSF